MHPTTASVPDVSNVARGHDVRAQAGSGGLQVVEITRDVLDDLLRRAEALAGQQLRNLAADLAGCTECLRCNLHGGPIEHTERCLTGGMLSATLAVRRQLERAPAPAWYYVPLADPATADAPPHYITNIETRAALQGAVVAEARPCEWCGPNCLGGACHNARKESGDKWGTLPGEVPERRVVCGEMVSDRAGGVHICDEEPRHSGWHIDSTHGKAWPSLVAWALEYPPVCDAAEIGLLCR